MIFVLLIGGMFNGTVQAQNDTISILHISDTHVIFNLSGYNHDIVEYRKQKHYDEGEGHLRQFLQNMPGKTNADMVVATGDLIDFFQAETPGGQMQDIQPAQMSELLNDYHVPVYLTLGNHDVFSFDWNIDKMDHNQNFSGRARAKWIRNIPCFKNGTYYSEIFKTGTTTYRLIFLDDSFYQFLPNDSTNVPYIDKSQVYWLNAQLNESSEDVEIIFMHIPFSKTVNSSNELYSTLLKHPSCKLILAGHHHNNLVSNFPSDQDKKLVQVQTGALVNSVQNWRLIRLTGKMILVSFPGKTENELQIPVN